MLSTSLGLSGSLAGSLRTALAAGNNPRQVPGA